MNRRIKLFALFAVMACCRVWAQDVAVTAKIDSVNIMIGEQAIMDLEVKLKADMQAKFPILTDTIVSGIEIVDVARIDTIYSKDKQSMTLKKSYTITSFAPKMYLIPPMEIEVSGKEYKTQPISLKVETFPDIEVANPEEYFGTKDILTPPFVWGDWIKLILSILFIAPFVLLLIYMIMRLMDNKPIIRRIKLEATVLPHIAAMTELEEIKNRKSWQTAGPKEYYTELTDVLRAYMKKRFNFNALEMTSAEIIEQLAKVENREEINRLQELFTTADLVKFAKFKPLQGEYDNNFTKVVEFIDNTKEEPDPDAKPEPTEKIVVEKRSLQTKLLLGGVALLAVIGIVTCIVIIINEGGDFLRTFFS